MHYVPITLSTKATISTNQSTSYTVTSQYTCKQAAILYIYIDLQQQFKMTFIL